MRNITKVINLEENKVIRQQVLTELREAGRYFYNPSLGTRNFVIPEEKWKQINDK